MVMMMMKKMRMRMRRKSLREDDQEPLLEPPPLPDLQTLSPSMMTITGLPTMSPTTTSPRRSLIRQIADAVVGLVRSVTATVARSRDNVHANDDVRRNNHTSDNAAGDKDDYDLAKCVVGSIRTYCQNCRRHHYALVSL